MNTLAFTVILSLVVGLLEIYSRQDAKAPRRQAVIRKHHVLSEAFFVKTIFLYNVEFPLRARTKGSMFLRDSA